MLVALVVVLYKYDVFPSVTLVRVIMYFFTDVESLEWVHDKIAEVRDLGKSTGCSGAVGRSAVKKSVSYMYLIKHCILINELGICTRIKTNIHNCDYFSIAQYGNDIFMVYLPKLYTNECKGWSNRAVIALCRWPSMPHRIYNKPCEMVLKSSMNQCT